MCARAKDARHAKFIFIMLALFLMCGGCIGNSGSEKCAVKINGYSITAGEFTELFMESGPTEDTSEARRKFVKNLVKRKLLLQEAEREGLDRQKIFLKTIERFWEEALLKVMIDSKAGEFSRRLDVSEEELEDFYKRWKDENPENTESFDKLREVIRWQLLREKKRFSFDSWVDDLEGGSEIEINEEAIGIK
ncbi:MAG: hypothetical protein ABID09_07790 [Candidatus Omnitrophota bacterium]